MSHFKTWIAAVPCVLSVCIGACATSPSRRSTLASSRPPAEQASEARRQYSIPDFGTLELSVPPSWQEEIKPEKAGSYFAFTVSYRGKTPEDFLVLISTFVAGVTQGGVPDPETIKSVLTETSKGDRAHAVEKDIAMLALPCSEGTGYYYSMTDAAYQPEKPGDYKYMTQGMCPVDGRLLFFTVLTSSKDSDVLKLALHAVTTAEKVS